MTGTHPKAANDNLSGRGKAKPCPICGKAAVVEFSPFCSRRCSDVDLHRWLGGAYQLPAGPIDDAEETGLDSQPD